MQRMVSSGVALLDMPTRLFIFAQRHQERERASGVPGVECSAPPCAKGAPRIARQLHTRHRWTHVTDGRMDVHVLEDDGSGLDKDGAVGGGPSVLVLIRSSRMGRLDGDQRGASRY